MRHVPPRLYKYFAPERVTVLSEGQLRYSPLGSFNDPFEGRPHIPALIPEDSLPERVETAFEEMWQELYDRQSASVRSQMSPSEFHRTFKQAVLSDQGETWSKFQTLLPSSIQTLHKRMDEHLGAACFSEVPDSLLMWAHYAAQHTGFVVEFDAHHPHFDERRSEADEFRCLRRVSYREARPAAVFSQLDVASAFLVKSGHWEYEREWRIFRPLPDASRTIPGEPYSIHLFDFPRAAVTGIIIGSRAVPSTVDEIAAVRQMNPDYASVPIKRAVPDPQHFLLRIVDDAA